MGKFSFTPMVAIIIGALAPCAAAQTESPDVCRNPRAPITQICGYIYKPVCAVHRSGLRLTYSNPCEACKVRTVVRHVPGACKNST